MCHRLDTGEEVYSQRVGDPTSGWASPVADGRGRIYFATAGRSFVIRAGEKFELLATNDLGDPSHPSPAVANGRLYLVGEKKIHCVGAR